VTRRGLLGRLLGVPLAGLSWKAARTLPVVASAEMLRHWANWRTASGNVKADYCTLTTTETAGVQYIPMYGVHMADCPKVSEAWRA